MTIEIQRGKVVTVARGEPTLNAGQGILKGMGVIWKHWVASFHKNKSYDQIHGTFTVEYPEERTKLPEAYRNMPILLYDDASGQELCTSCFQCQRICPPQVIHMTQAKDPTTGKAVPAVAEFVIEYDACMSCGFCAEVCPFDAIKMDHVFELSTADHSSLTVHKEALNRPVSYYEAIAPQTWAEAKDSAYKKLQGNIKRRPGLLGVAPQLVEQLRTEGKGLRTEGAPPAPSAAPVAEAPAAPVAEAPAAPAAPATADEKAARLAAIRAKNAAKQTTDNSPQDSAPAGMAIMHDAPEAPAAPVAPTDEKAARLAAIRAKNAAKQTTDRRPQTADDSPQSAALATPVVGLEMPVAEAPAPPSVEAPSVLSPQSSLDEKAARLAAIRAKNQAKSQEPRNE